MFDALPEWLSVLLAMAGLFGGSGAGVYFGGVRRARLDDRRELLKAHYPWASAPFVRWPKGYARDETLPLDLSMSLEAEMHFYEVHSVNSLMKLLPWKDRALWIRELTEVAYLVEDNMRQLKEQIDDRAPSQFNQLDADFAGELASSIRKRYSPLTTFLWSGRKQGAIAPLEAHLLRKVNPTITSRFVDRGTTWWILRHGPRPWSRSIRLTNMSLSAVLDERPSFGGPRLLQQPRSRSDGTATTE